MIQWLRPHASYVRGTGWIPGQGTKITHATQHGHRVKKKNKKKKIKNKYMKIKMKL